MIDLSTKLVIAPIFTLLYVGCYVWLVWSYIDFRRRGIGTPYARTILLVTAAAIVALIAVTWLVDYR